MKCNLSKTLLLTAAGMLLAGCSSTPTTQDGERCWCSRTWHKFCMSLDDPQPVKTDEVIESHRQKEVNREEELKLICDKAWIPVYIRGQEGADGKNAITLPPELEPYLLFSRDGKVTGFAGVSPFNGTFAVNAPNRLRVNALSTAMKSGTHLDYEMLFMAQLNEVNKFSILPDGMIEMKNRDDVMLRCRPIAISELKNPPKSAMADAPEAKPATIDPTAPVVIPAEK